MKKPTFFSVISIWFCLSIVVTVISAYTINTPLITNICAAALGVYLLIWPVWPKGLDGYWPEEKCRLFIRILAVVEIILAFVH